jgi:ubiquitin-conjugating enzyme E2 variant
MGNGRKSRFAMDVVIVVVQIIACIAIADCIFGFVHWLEDGYGSPSWAVIGPNVIQPNILHHFDSSHLTHHSWLYNARGPIAATAVAVVGAAALGVMPWQFTVVAALGINGNEFHMWSHRAPRNNGKIVTLIQRIGLLQSPQYHAQHHGGQKRTHYCTGTVYVNPILDKVRLWSALEMIIFWTTRVRRRPDPSLERGANRNAPTCTAVSCRPTALAL